MLRLENVSKQFKGQTVLNALNFEIHRNEMVSIMGRSGSGKSTLLSLMAGLQSPDSGSIIFSERELTGLNEESLAQFRLHNIGFVFQDFLLIPSLSVYDNIYIAAHPRTDIPKSIKHQRVIELIKEVGLNAKVRQRIDKLSGGERQRVAIARSLVNRPQLVLADEPTGNLDSATADEIMKLFRSLHKSIETSFVIITHDEYIASITDKTYQLANGELQ